ncbi:MAG: hypothetical protein KAQ62_19520 [Cyclobacteriaceae bacterium]|nr:hypothetical protein [Cyclobacteriaceae bacterium]
MSFIKNGKERKHIIDMHPICGTCSCSDFTSGDVSNHEDFERLVVIKE